MHDDVRLGGAVWAYLTVVLFITAMLAAFVLIDSLRPVRGKNWRLREPLWTYTLGQGFFFAVMMLGQIGAQRFVFAVTTSLLTPFALAQGIAYLLRVVFPKPDATPPAEEEPAPWEPGDEPPAPPDGS